MGTSQQRAPLAALRGGKVWHLVVVCDNSGAFKTLCGHSHHRRELRSVNQAGRLSEVTCMQCRRRIDVWRMQMNQTAPDGIAAAERRAGSHDHRITHWYVAGEPEGYRALCCEGGLRRRLALLDQDDVGCEACRRLASGEALFVGKRAHVVEVDGRHLPHQASLRLFNHSPTGFSWGYGGSGPAQLALALLMHVTSDGIAVRYHQDFKWAYVAKWDGDGTWRITAGEIAAWLQARTGKEEPHAGVN